MTEDGRAVVEIHPAADQFPATENGNRCQRQSPDLHHR